jgi:hypothetical protein
MALSLGIAPYRSPGRAAVPARIALPAWRTLLAPLARGALVVVALFAPLIAFDAWIVPRLEATGQRLIPAVEISQDVFGACAALASLGVLVAVLARRVVPSWQGMRRLVKVLYVALLVLAQMIVVVGAETGLFVSRGGLRLFEPTFVRSSNAPDGRVAYLYAGGLLGCALVVYVAPPYGLTMSPAAHIERNSCSQPEARVRWSRDGKPELVGPDGAQLESETLRGFLFGMGGC